MLSKLAKGGALAKGSSRFIDFVHDNYSVSAGGNTIGSNNVSTQGRSRLGTPGLSAGTANIFTPSSAQVQLWKGKQCIGIPSGLSYGMTCDFGLLVATVRPQKGAQQLRQHVTRIVVQLSIDEGANPLANINNDVGLFAKFSDGRFLINDWTGGSGLYPSYFGCAVMLRPAGWCWVVKQNNDVTLYDVTPLAWPVNYADWCEVEFRIIDATDTQEASIQLWLNGVKVLTRYWTNPAGVSSYQLPPFSVKGAQIFSVLRNTSTGPQMLYAGDWSTIVGPNDAGTL